MQFSKPKLSVEFVKEFNEKIYQTEIDLSDVRMKVFIIEEEREDVKVIFEGMKDLVSNVEFDIVDSKLKLKIISRETSGISSSVKIHSVFTMENKLSIYMPAHFNNYQIIGNDANIRINNLVTDYLNTKINMGSVKVKYCTINKDFTIKADNAVVSVKSIENEGDILIENTTGITKFRDIDINGNVVIDSVSGMLIAKNIKARKAFTSVTESGSIDLDDVYASVVNIKAKNGIVNYFNGNFSKDFDVNIDVTSGVVRTNVKREEIH